MTDVVPTLLTGCGSPTNRNGVIICEDILNKKNTNPYKAKQNPKIKRSDSIDKLKVISLFSGIGAFEGGLERLGIDFELVGISEIEVYPLVAYAAIHCGLLDYEHLFDSEEDIDNKREHIRHLGLIKNNKPLDVDKLNVRELNSIYHSCVLTNNLGDIGKVDVESVPDCNLITYGFPCQPFSQAGMRLGFEDNRGNMFFEAYRIIEHKLPKYFIFENVEGLLSHDKGNTIRVVLEYLGKLPYEITMDLVNAKDMGIPQNRNRLFCIGRRIEHGQ